jgi:hypothetical protein
MTHTVAYNPDLGLIETLAQGKLTSIEAKEIISEIAQVAIDQNCFLCLSDYREATMDMSTLQIHEIPKVLSNMVMSVGLHPNRFKRAIVVENGFQDFHFFETVTLNAGQNIKLFQDIEAAKTWLLQE